MGPLWNFLWLVSLVNPGTVDAIAIVIDSLRLDKITSTKSCCAFLDLKKAFDTVDHNLLLKKCELYGLRGHVMELITSYLTDRKQFVLHNSLSSRVSAIICGVPQGSVLGPSLFLLYINDMPKVCHTLKVTLFADDTCLHCSYDNKNIYCVQQDLTKIEKWLGENKLTLNLQKTYLLTPSSPLLTNKANFSFNGVTIAYAQCVKYLGLHIDMNLTFKEHVKFVQKKFFGNIQSLRFFRQFVSQKRMLHLYKIYIQPVFQYGVLIYGSANKTDLLALEKIQILLWRILFGIKKFNSINNIRQKHRLLSIRELHVYELMKCLSKIIRNEQHNTELNDVISKDEIEVITNDSKRIKTIKSRSKGTKQESKILKWRLRKLFNVLVKWDVSIVLKIVQCKSKQLPHLLHDLKDNYICDNEELIKAFW